MGWDTGQSSSYLGLLLNHHSIMRPLISGKIISTAAYPCRTVRTLFVTKWQFVNQTQLPVYAKAFLEGITTFSSGVV